MTKKEDKLLAAEFVDQEESVVFRVGDKAWKLYPDIYTVDQLREYQRITAEVAAVLDAQEIRFQIAGKSFTFSWSVVPIDEVIMPDGELAILNNPTFLFSEAIRNLSDPVLKVRFPYTVSEFIPGPTMDEIIHGEAPQSEYAEVFNLQEQLTNRTYAQVLEEISEGLNSQLGLKWIDLADRNIKPSPGERLIVTDVASVVRFVRAI